MTSKQARQTKKERTNSSTRKGGKKIQKGYKKVKYCSNCLVETNRCKCVNKVTHIRLECINCGEWLDDFWNYCPVCGETTNL